MVDEINTVSNVVSNDNYIRFIGVFVAALMGAFVAPFMNNLYAKNAAKKVAKQEKRPKAYEQIMYYLICDGNVSGKEFSDLKCMLLTYADKNVIKAFYKYLKSETVKNKRNLINVIRSELEMGSKVGDSTFNDILDLKLSNQIPKDGA